VSVAEKKGTKMAAKWSPAQRAVWSEPFPPLRVLSWNGPQAVKGAPLLGAAQRTLDGEDRSEMITEEGKAGRTFGEKWSAILVPSPAASNILQIHCALRVTVASRIFDLTAFDLCADMPVHCEVVIRHVVRVQLAVLREMPALTMCQRLIPDQKPAGAQEGRAGATEGGSNQRLHRPDPKRRPTRATKTAAHGAPQLDTTAPGEPDHLLGRPPCAGTGGDVKRQMGINGREVFVPQSYVWARKERSTGLRSFPAC